MKENGFKIIYKGTENFITLLKIWLTKALGNKTCLKEKELYSEMESPMMNLLKLTIKIFPKLMKILGISLKDTLPRILKKDKEPIFL
jgi:hypothetical protein